MRQHAEYLRYLINPVSGEGEPEREAKDEGEPSVDQGNRARDCLREKGEETIDARSLVST